MQQADRIRLKSIYFFPEEKKVLEKGLKVFLAVILTWKYTNLYEWTVPFGLTSSARPPSTQHCLELKAHGLCSAMKTYLIGTLAMSDRPTLPDDGAKVFEFLIEVLIPS